MPIYQQYNLSVLPIIQYPFSLPYLLLLDEHGLIEELLQFLVRVIDAQLLERVQIEDLESEQK